jgi:A/G-specific adenine glycosylase
MSWLKEKGFSESLLAWWQDNSRDFPWRSARSPYRILVAEVLLHRTRAEQVAPIFKAFIKKYPDVQSLAHAEEQDIEKMLRPLGLRWRVKLLVAMAKEIAFQHEAKVPSEKAALESLPGVSDYIASAVRSFAMDLPDPILDTNTVRIIGRVFGMPMNDASRRNRVFRTKYASLMDVNRPREFNFAMIDLAALLCRPANPICDKCPVQSMCELGISRSN